MSDTASSLSDRADAGPRRAPDADRAAARGEIRAAVISLVVGATLLTAKFAAYVLTDSAAIFSDALESIVNVLASAAAVYSIVLSHRPADASHPYGHGKVEFLSAGFEGGMMMVAALVMVLRAVEQLVRGAHVNEGQIVAGLVLLGVATAFNAALGVYLVRHGKRGGSIALEADGKHLLADAVTSVGVVAALLAVKLTGWRRLDPLAAVLVAAWVAREAFGLLRRSAAGLMDEQDLDDERTIAGILDAHVGASGQSPRICSYHKLRHRHSGRYHWVDFHLVVPAHLNIDEGHRVASVIEHEIEQAIGVGNATAHVEPCITGECLVCR